MAERWDELTHRVWDNSEVMKEFEAMIISSCDRFSKLAKIVEAQNAIEQGADSAKKLQQAVEPANAATQELVTTLKQSLSDDAESAEETCDGLDISDEEYNDAKDALFAELEKLSYIAADNGNIKLAYQIERAIYDLEEEL